MATPDSVKTKIQNLISMSNASTGRTDTDLTAAVGALIDGYGAGVGLNARIFTTTLASDIGGYTTFITNDFLKAIRSESNAFVLVRYMGSAANMACIHTVLTANFPIYYNASTMYSSIVFRSTESSGHASGNSYRLDTDKDIYNGHMKIDTDGMLYGCTNATYPFKAGEYQIIAGTLEML